MPTKKIPQPAIGSTPCPIRGCSERAAIKKFAHLATRDDAKRFAGKLYLQCPTHGRIGQDARPALQSYILENPETTWHGDAPPDAAPAAPAPTNAPPSARPAPAGTSSSPKGPAGASSSAPPKRPAPDPSPAAGKRSNFWEW